MFILEGSGWGECLKTHILDLEEQSKALIASEREKEILKLHVLTEKAAKDIIDTIVNEPIYEMKDNFWKSISFPY